MDAESEQFESLYSKIEQLKANIIWLEARNKALREMRLEDKALITELQRALEAK